MNECRILSQSCTLGPNPVHLRRTQYKKGHSYSQRPSKSNKFMCAVRRNPTSIQREGKHASAVAEPHTDEANGKASRYPLPLTILGTSRHSKLSSIYAPFAMAVSNSTFLFCKTSMLSPPVTILPQDTGCAIIWFAVKAPCYGGLFRCGSKALKNKCSKMICNRMVPVRR